ncbi:unnamed protein product [Ophioblennius macclurei]
MEDLSLIKLPASKEERPAAKKRSRDRGRGQDQNQDRNPQREEKKRRSNVKRLAALREEDGSVKLLEELLFGAEEELLGRLREEEKEEPTGSLLLEEPEEEQQEDEEEEQEEAGQESRGPAWVDEDDELDEEVDMTHRYRRNLMKGDAEAVMSKRNLQQRMKEQFQKSMGGAPSWAEKKKTTKRKKTMEDEDDDEEDDEEDDLLRRTGNFVASSASLPSGTIRIKRCLHANSARPSQDRLSTVQFHPSAQVVMTAGLDQSISLFQVDGKTNPKIQSVVLDNFPVHKAQFSLDGETVIATGLRNKMFYIYDMMEGRVVPVSTVRGLKESRVREFSVCPDGGALLLSGNNGYLHLLTLKTNEVVRSMKINGNIGGVAFSQDGGKAFVSSEEGEVYVWDLRSSRCVNRFTDDGCVRATSIAASPNGQYLACGSQSGVVNIYSQDSCLTSPAPKPLKAVMNLLTSATSLAFNPSSEILAVASRVQDEALRLVHVASRTVFSNFPIADRKYVYRAACLDFSPHGGFFSLANNKGHAPLMRLLHYNDF